MIVARAGAVGQRLSSRAGKHSHSDWSSLGKQGSSWLEGCAGESKDGDSFTSFSQKVVWMWSSREGQSTEVK